MQNEWKESEYFEKATRIRFSPCPSLSPFHFLTLSKMENSFKYSACLFLLEVVTDVKQVKYKIMMLNSLEGLKGTLRSLSYDSQKAIFVWTTSCLQILVQVHMHNTSCCPELTSHP